MRNAVIVDAVRTPTGRRNGVFKDIHAADLAAIPLKALVERNDLDPALVDDVLMGCVSTTGEQGFNVARNAVLPAGYPESVVATTIDRQCGSSQQAAHFAAQGVIAGAYDVAIAAGIESMTRIPMGIQVRDGLLGDRFDLGFDPEPRENPLCQCEVRAGLSTRGVHVGRECDHRGRCSAHGAAARVASAKDWQVSSARPKALAETGTRCNIQHYTGYTGYHTMRLSSLYRGVF